jgi:cell division transport system permease protein
VHGSSFGYLLKEGFRNIKQNHVISLAAIGVLIACLLLVGASVLFTMNINSLVGYFESQNEALVYLEDTVTDSRITAIQSEISSLDNVSSITFISKEEGLEDWMETLGDDGTLLSWLVDDNPLQDSFCVVVRDLSRLEETTAQLRAINGVETVSASGEVAAAVTALKRGVNTAGIAIVAILAAVSFLIVANTIRISVFSRRKEISIMKYVGATDAFIRLPFLTEGLLLGIISATIAFFLLWGGYTLVLRAISDSSFMYSGILGGNLLSFSSVALRLYLYFLAGGCVIGGLGSVIFVRKYLRV